ncbi:cytochrome P450 [Rhodococcus koreensis]|uniref:cytochrome P450 n=1 Tax=Rhodococcus koreensis TaxID=99653 RepID=UPI0036706872
MRSAPTPRSSSWPLLFTATAEPFPFADRFEPEIWIDGRAEHYPGLVPFSAGPTACPGRHVVLLVTSTVLANLFTRADFTLTSRTTPDPDQPLPATFDNFENHLLRPMSSPVVRSAAGRDR